MISDGGGAVVIAAADVARDCSKKPVWILGSGEATKYPENGGDITVSAARAIGSAGVRRSRRQARRNRHRDDLRLVQHHGTDVARRSRLLQERRGRRIGHRRAAALRPAEGRTGAEYRRRRFVVEPSGHARHLPADRGDAAVARRVDVAGERTRRLAVAHGNGGMLGSRHSGGTVILGRRLRWLSSKRPLPNLKEHDTREFWQATKDGKLTLSAVRRLRHRRVLSAPPLHGLPRRHAVVAHRIGTRHGVQLQRRAQSRAPVLSRPGALCSRVDRSRRRSAAAVEHRRRGRSRQRHQSGRSA